MDILTVILITLLTIHIGGAVHTIYYHRCLSHKTLICSPALEHIFRFIVWLNGWDWPDTAKTYVAQHRKHHATSDTKDDPHSPHHLGFFSMFDFEHADPNRPYYLTPEEVEKYASDIKTPNDWIQRVIYDHAGFNISIFKWNFKIKLSAIALFLVFWLFFSTVWAIVFTIIHRFCHKYIIPLINYIFHKGTFDYVKEHHGHDKSKIVFPIGILLSGEELHANHHYQPSNPKLSRRWFEFDLGWVYINILSFLKLLKIRQMPKS